MSCQFVAAFLPLICVYSVFNNFLECLYVKQTNARTRETVS